MRLFEILILVTILPILVGYFFAPTRRPQWFAYLPGIGVLFIVIHLIVEGYRVHMAPAYALTIILLLQETLTADPNDQRELMVQAWYPAESPPDGAPEVYMEYPPLLLDNLSLVPTHSYRDAPVSGDQPSYPVVIFSHGFGLSLIMQNTIQMEELASHGYIVFSIAHPFDTLKIVYSDGRTVSLDSDRAELFGKTLTASKFFPDMKNSKDLAEKESILKKFLAEHLIGDEILRLWTDDTVFVINELEKIHAGAQKSLLAGKLDLERLGVFGHSMGGATAGQVCLVDPRCKAGINMDGPPWGDSIDQNLKKPFMFMYNEFNQGVADTIYERAANTAYRVTIKGISHGQYGEIHLWVRLPSMPPYVGSIDSQRALKIITDYTLAFLMRISTTLTHLC